MKDAEHQGFLVLEECLSFLQKYYDEKNIFGIFTYDDLSNIVCVVIPTFEEVCLNGGLIAERQLFKDKILDVIDIRYAYHATRDGFPQLIQSLYTDIYIVNSRYEHMFYRLFKDNREKFHEGIHTRQPPQELKEAIVRIIKIAFDENNSTIKFIKYLTDSEKVVLKRIIAEVGDEGVFKLGLVAASAGLSRITVSNLINKMKECEIAEIKHFGNKGTYIKIKDSIILGD